MDYIKTVSYPLIKEYRDENGNKGRKPYMFLRYSMTHGSGNDYFYFLISREDLINKNSPNYMKGDFLDKSEGDQLNSIWRI